MAAHHVMSPPTAMHGHPGIPPPAPAPPPPPHAGLPANSLPLAQPGGVEGYVTQTFLRAWMACGTAAEKLGNNPMALDSFHKILRYDPGNVDALRSIASVLRADDKYDQAVEYIRHMITINGTDGESWSSLGHCYLMMDELQQAYSAYQSALYNLRDPKEPKLWYGIGILYDRYGSLDHAEEAFSQVMRMAPKFDKANEIYFRLGIIYKQQAKFDQSLECFTYIVNNPPSPLNQTDIWFQIGHVYEQQKMYEKAKQAYIKVLERDGKHAKVLQQLGWLHHQQSSDYGSQESAIEYLEQSVSSDQTDAQSWYLLGRCYMSQYKFPKAYEAYQQAVYRDGRNPTFWCSIGVLYYQINQYRDALDAYSRAIRLNPNISEVWYDLGTLYESCNNQTTDALDAYERAAELDPQNEAIKARLNLLRSGQSTGHLNQNPAPLPQDVPPHQYQPTGATASVQAAWGAPVPSHTGQHHPPGPAPPPLQSRDWGSRPNALSSGPPPPQSATQGPPPPPLHHYDQRDTSRHPPQRQPSPKTGGSRIHDHYAHNGAPRPLSPSPRSRHSVIDQRGPPSAHALHASLPGTHAPTPSRISNPNFGGQHLPPTPLNGPTAVNHSAPSLYSRSGTPPASSRPPQDSRQRSPGSMYQPPPQYPRHPDPMGPNNIASGAPAPTSALEAAEAAARERTRPRQDRSVPPQKRLRDWDSREDLQSYSHKKNASEENRARLDDPHGSRRLQSPSRAMSYELERERGERERMPIGGPPSQAASPGASRKAEEMRRADEAYRPSAAAHHPAPLSTVMQPEGRDAPNDYQGASLPPISTVTANGADGDAPKQEPEAERMEVDEEPKPAEPIPKRPEEPAARKVEVDENYDDDSSDETKTGQTLPASGPASAPTSGRESQASNRAVEPTSVDRNDTSPRAGVAASA